MSFNFYFELQTFNKFPKKITNLEMKFNKLRSGSTENFNKFKKEFTQRNQKSTTSFPYQSKKIFCLPQH